MDGEIIINDTTPMVWTQNILSVFGQKGRFKIYREVQEKMQKLVARKTIHQQVRVRLS